MRKNLLLQKDKELHNFNLTGGKFMLKFHLRQSVFTYRACGPFTKNRERIQKFRETDDLKHF